MKNTTTKNTTRNALKEMRKNNNLNTLIKERETARRTTAKKEKFNYHASELNSLNVKPNPEYKIKIKIYNPNNGNNTKYISITHRQYKFIKNILINQ